MKHWTAVLYIIKNVFYLHLNANVHLLFVPPTCVQASLCLTGECVERLPVRMLLLPSILAPDLQRAEEKSSIPRLLFLLSQIHRFDLPAGGALGLDTSNTSFCRPLLPPVPQGCRSWFNHTSSGLQPLLVTSEISLGTQCVPQKEKLSLCWIAAQKWLECSSRGTLHAILSHWLTYFLCENW